MSMYVEKMKDVLVAFNNTAQDLHKRIQYAYGIYSPDEAKKEANKLQKQLLREAETARDRIEAILQQAITAAKQWANPDGAKIDTADMELLRGDFSISSENIHSLLVKHQSNGVMVNAIAKYAKDHGIIPNYIPNLEDKLWCYKMFANSANEMIAESCNSIGYSTVSSSLVRWAKPGNMSQRAEMVLFGIKNQEPAAVQPKAVFGFDFKHLKGR